MKKLFSLALTLLMALTLCVPAMADETPTTPDYSITVNGAKLGETYIAYKIFNATQDSTGTKISYSISATSGWKSVLEGYTYDLDNDPDTAKANVFTFQSVVGDATRYTVTFDKRFTDGADLAKYLSEHTPTTGLTENTDYWTVTASSVSGSSSPVAKFEGLSLGYYFVKTSTGALCSLDTNNSNVNISEKNSYPTLDKKVSTTDGSYGDAAVTAFIGDTVYYQLTMTVPETVDKAITVHDSAEAGLTIDVDSIVASDGTNTVSFTKSTPTDGCDFELVFAANDIKGKTVTITYTAELNKSAEIHEETNDNSAWLSYSAYTTPVDTVSVKTYKASFIKVDGDTKTPLAGVTFKLLSDGEPLSFVNEGDGVYRVPDATESTGLVDLLTTPTTGVVEIKGLEGKQNYYLREIATLDGYNPLTDDVLIAIADSNNEYSEPQEATEGQTGEVIPAVSGNNYIENFSGMELPSTGGMGTTIFYTVGGILMAGAVILLITKKKMSSEEQ